MPLNVGLCSAKNTQGYLNTVMGGRVMRIGAFHPDSYVYIYIKATCDDAWHDGDDDGGDGDAPSSV